jgi:hypothetical protein
MSLSKNGQNADRHIKYLKSHDSAPVNLCSDIFSSHALPFLASVSTRSYRKYSTQPVHVLTARHQDKLCERRRFLAQSRTLWLHVRFLNDCRYLPICLSSLIIRASNATFDIPFPIFFFSPHRSHPRPALAEGNQLCEVYDRSKGMKFHSNLLLPWLRTSNAYISDCHWEHSESNIFQQWDLRKVLRQEDMYPQRPWS